YDNWDRRSAQPDPQVVSAYFPALRGVCAMPPASPQSRMGTMLPTKCRWLEAGRLQHLPPAYLPCIFDVWVMRAKCLIPWSCRGVAQPGSAPALGAGGQEFKSPRPDHSSKFSISEGKAAVRQFRLALLFGRRQRNECMVQE